MAHSQKRIASLKTKFCLFAALVSVIPALPLQAQPDLPESATLSQQSPYTLRMLHLSPDGRYAMQVSTRFWGFAPAMCYDTETTLQLWDVGTGRLKWRRTTPLNAIGQSIFSPDSTRFFVYGFAVRQEGAKFVERRLHAEIIPIEDNAEPIRLEVEENEMLGSIQFLPDSQSLIGLRYTIDKQEKLLTQVWQWDATTGKFKGAIEDKPQLAQNGMWTANSRILAAASNQLDSRNENELIAWSLPELTLRGTQSLGTEIATTIAISPNGKKLAYKTSLPGVAQTSNEVFLWDIETGVLESADAPPVAEYSIHGLEFSSDSQNLIGLGSARGEAPLWHNDIWVWSTQTGALVKSLNNNQRRELDTYQFKLLPDGKSFVGQTSKGQIELRSLEDGSLIRSFE